MAKVKSAENIRLDKLGETALKGANASNFKELFEKWAGEDKKKIARRTAIRVVLGIAPKFTKGGGKKNKLNTVAGIDAAIQKIKDEAKADIEALENKKKEIKIEEDLAAEQEEARKEAVAKVDAAFEAKKKKLLEKV